MVAAVKFYPSESNGFNFISAFNVANALSSFLSATVRIDVFAFLELILVLVGMYKDFQFSE